MVCRRSCCYYFFLVFFFHSFIFLLLIYTNEFSVFINIIMHNKCFSSVAWSARKECSRNICFSIGHLPHIFYSSKSIYIYSCVIAFPFAFHVCSETIRFVWFGVFFHFISNKSFGVFFLTSLHFFSAVVVCSQS